MFFAAIDVEEIIDHLHVDTATLRVCSLVCRAWLPPCRYHLFGEIYLPGEPGKVEALLELLESDNYILPFLRHVSFYNVLEEYSLHPFFDLLSVLKQFAPALKSFSFHRYYLRFDNLEYYFPLNQLTQLGLTGCAFEFPNDLMDLFSALPCIAKLIVDGVSFQLRHGAPPNRDVVLLPKLCSLEVYRGMVEIILPLLAPAPALREAKFCICNARELSVIGEFLGDAAPHLDIFSLGYTGWNSEKNIGQCLQNIDISSFTSLRTFEFNMYSHAALEDIPAVLERITSPTINRIELSFHGKPELEEGLWRGIPTILTRPNFRQLRKLEFGLGERTDAKEIEMWVLAELHEPDLRGITITVRPPSSSLL